MLLKKSFFCSFVTLRTPEVKIEDLVGPPPKLLVPWLIMRGGGFADEIRYASSLFPWPRYLPLAPKQGVKSRYWRFFVVRGIWRGLGKHSFYISYLIQHSLLNHWTYSIQSVIALTDDQRIPNEQNLIFNKLTIARLGMWVCSASEVSDLWVCSELPYP